MTAVEIGLEDLRAGWRKAPLAFALAVREIRMRYSRTALGPMWITIAQGVWVAGLAYVFSSVFKQDVDTYIIYLAAGVPIWAFISTLLIEAPSTFVAAKGMMDSFHLPWSLHALRRVIANLYVFAQHLLIWLAVVVIFGHPPTINLLLFPLALAVLVIGAWAVVLILGTLGARYRDLQPAVTSTMAFAFVLTPVFWMRDALPAERQFLADWNPLYHYLDLVRAPLIGEAPAMMSWIVCGGLSAALVGVAVAVFCAFRRELFIWV